MAFKTIDAVNTTEGLHTIFIYVNEITSGLFSRLILLAFFLIIGMGAYLFQKGDSGNGDLPGSLAIAGFVTSGLAIIFSFIPGLVNGFDIIVTFSATFLFVLWLFVSKRKE